MKEQELPCAADCLFERKCAEQQDINGNDSCTAKAIKKILGTNPRLVLIEGDLVKAYAMLGSTLKIIHIMNGEYSGQKIPGTKGTDSIRENK